MTLFEPAPPERPAPDLDLIDRAAQVLGKAKQPIIFAGGGVIGSQAWDELQQLAEALEAPVIMTNNAKGALSDRHYLAHGARSMRQLREGCDAALVVGTRFVAGPHRRHAGA